jgi:hypothetical protein
MKDMDVPLFAHNRSAAMIPSKSHGKTLRRDQGLSATG